MVISLPLIEEETPPSTCRAFLHRSWSKFEEVAAGGRAVIAAGPLEVLDLDVAREVASDSAQVAARAGAPRRRAAEHLDAPGAALGVGAASGRALPGAGPLEGDAAQAQSAAQGDLHLEQRVDRQGAIGLHALGLEHRGRVGGADPERHL